MVKFIKKWAKRNGMTSPYAEITLYFAYTSTFSYELGTGKFTPEDIYNSSVEKRRIAMEHIHRSIDLKTMKYGIGGCLRDEEKAAILIAYVEREIPNAHGLIIPTSCLHGAVFFNRKIKFPECIEDSRKELLEKLRQSGQKFEKSSSSLENCLKFFT